MTVADPKSQVPIQPPPITPVSGPPKGDIFNKIADGISGWIGNLTGRNRNRKATPQQPSQTPSPQSPQPSVGQTAQSGPANEDSVTEDLEQLKKLVGKVSKNINTSMGPVVEKGIKSSSQKASAFSKANAGFLRTVLKIFFIVILLIIVAYIGMQFFKKIPGGNGGGEATPTSEESKLSVTPTPIVYNPLKPSVYADDPVVLKLEQDIDVLTREVSGTNIRETQLNPPPLDFAIGF